MFTWEVIDELLVTRQLEDLVIVHKVHEPWGGLSNMSNAFPLCVNGVRISSSEALYQALRFPNRPDWQAEILAAPHAMQAKMTAKKEGRRAHHSRPGWDAIRIDVMRWVLHIKLAQHRKVFGDLLLSTDNRPIVELSRHDDFWGAKADRAEPSRLRRANMLGRLLMELRNELRGTNTEQLDLVVPPDVSNFRLLGEEIRDWNAEPQVALLSES